MSRLTNSGKIVFAFFALAAAIAVGGKSNSGGLLCTKINGAIYVPHYDAFGRTITATGPLSDVFAFRFSTKYYDRETGFYYYGLRYYAPALRRWLTRDPIIQVSLELPMMLHMCFRTNNSSLDILHIGLNGKVRHMNYGSQMRTCTASGISV